MTDLLTAVSIIFIIAGPFLLVANRFKLPTVPLLILAGIIAGLFIDEGATLELAQYGIALLVFSFGLSIQFSAVRTVLADSEIAAVGQVFVVGSLGVGSGLVLGVPLAESIYLGIAAALSSTIVGTALLGTVIRQNLVHGRLAKSIHFIQDLLAIVFLLVLGAGTLAADPIATQLGYGLALLAAAVLVNRYLFDLIGRFAGGSDELMIISVISLLVVFIGAAESAGISIVIGAFAAGLAVRHEPTEYLGLFNGLESIKDFFIAIFFLTVGALVAFPTLEKLLIAAVLVVLTAVVKPAVATAILMYKGYEARSATLTSLSTDQVSEFALIIAIEALLLGLLSQSVFDAIIFAAAVTMITSSVSQRHDERIHRALANRGLLNGTYGKIDEWSEVPETISDHVIIAGYGRQGRFLAETCERVGQPYVVIENDPSRQRTVASECAAFVFGDAMESYSWEKANAEDAKLIVSTIDSEPVSRRLLSLEFSADVILRESDRATALELFEAGALYVSVSELLAGQRLVQQLQAVLDGELTPEELRDEQLTDLEPRTNPVSQRQR
ncbi:cation:proton antiporter [Natronorubrum sp. A-ect3]|uniref:cation:proton antiporter domain-containing protein n=1 Tax=Natronorubrum sp. A-ect3 TaxID=3242698 RepID=UPI00359D10F9